MSKDRIKVPLLHMCVFIHWFIELIDEHANAVLNGNFRLATSIRTQRWVHYEKKKEEKRGQTWLNSMAVVFSLIEWTSSQTLPFILVLNDLTKKNKYLCHCAQHQLMHLIIHNLKCANVCMCVNGFYTCDWRIVEQCDHFFFLFSF